MTDKIQPLEEKYSWNVDFNLSNNIQNALEDIYASEYGTQLINNFLGIPLGNIIMAFLSLTICLAFSKIISNLAIKILQPLANKTKNFYDDRILNASKGPIAFVLVIIGFNLFFSLLFLNTPTIKALLQSMMVFNLFWFIFALAQALRSIIYTFTKKINNDLSYEVANFIIAIVRIIIITLGVGAILQVWGINIAGLIAGLGIGGLAFALAAKDTVSNLFGSIALLLDKSIKIGEWIKIKDIEGVVEDIGMRTTKIRSFEKSLITLPNHIVANNPIENYSRRNSRRIKLNIGLSYRTTSLQVENIIAEIKNMLKNNSSICQTSTTLVNLTSFNNSTLAIFVYTFSNTSDWGKHLQTKEEVNLAIRSIVSQNQAQFASLRNKFY